MVATTLAFTRTEDDTPVIQQNTTTQVSIKAHDSFESIGQQAWDNLADQTEFGTLFQTYIWNKTWWDNYGEKSDLVLLGAYEGETLVGIMPFYRSNTVKYRDAYLPLPISKLQLIGGYSSSDYLDLIYPAGRIDVLAAMFEWINANQSCWQVIDFYNICNESPTLAHLKTLATQHGYSHKVRKLYGAHTRLLDEAAKAKITKSKSIRRRFHLLKREGEVNFDVQLSKEDALKHIDWLYEQHKIRRADAGGGKSIFLEERNRQFYKQLIQDCDPKNLLCTRLSVDDETVAMHLGYLYKGHFFLYLPTFDLSKKHLSPGTAMIQSLLSYAVENDCTEFDFTIGDEGYKGRYANHERGVYRVILFKHHWMHTVFQGLKSGKRIVATMVSKLLSQGRK